MIGDQPDGGSLKCPYAWRRDAARSPVGIWDKVRRLDGSNIAASHRVARATRSHRLRSLLEPSSCRAPGDFAPNENGSYPESQSWPPAQASFGEDFAFNCQTPPLAIVEQNGFLAELLSEHTIFGPKVLDHVLLLAIDPAGQDQDQQFQGCRRDFIYSPDAVCKEAASGIGGLPVNHLKQRWLQPLAARLSFFTIRASHKACHLRCLGLIGFFFVGLLSRSTSTPPTPASIQANEQRQETPTGKPQKESSATSHSK